MRRLDAFLVDTALRLKSKLFFVFLQTRNAQLFLALFALRFFVLEDKSFELGLLGHFESLRLLDKRLLRVENQWQAVVSVVLQILRSIHVEVSENPRTQLYEVPIGRAEDPLHLEHKHCEISQCEEVFLHVALVGHRRVGRINTHGLHQLLLHCERYRAVAVHCAFFLKRSRNGRKTELLEKERQGSKDLQDHVLARGKIKCELLRVQPFTLHKAPQRTGSMRGGVGIARFTQ
mmetsp:Transcript_47871/g.83846  ORF Transcript_47871/g.83846 Transcript_47871/m.83846 type:complete len:233 (+) Transcript_47871:1-699(+)